MKVRDKRRENIGRRRFVQSLGAVAGLTLAGCAGKAGEKGWFGAAPHAAAGLSGDVNPCEDLMQEHGLLERILLIYTEAARRLDRRVAFDVAILNQTAAITRRFVEDYHERLEEEYVFPRLEAAGRETGLIAVLRQQHERGRQLTDDIVRLCAAPRRKQKLPPLLRNFEHMYRPHAAREDTVLFPAFRALVGRAAYAELGQAFEEQERNRLGTQGFEGTVQEVAHIEDELGIGDLASFTVR